MIKVTNLTGYATVVAGYLAQQTTRCSARQMAEQLDLPVPTVQKILGLLLTAKLITSTQGVLGGYQLTKTADSIRVSDLIQAIEGGMSLTNCIQGDNVCPRSQHCRVKLGWHQIHREVSDVFNRWTLADLIAENAS